MFRTGPRVELTGTVASQGSVVRTEPGQTALSEKEGSPVSISAFLPGLER